MDMEWCPDGDLQTVLETRAKEAGDSQQLFSAEWLIDLTLQMLETLEKLHTQRIAHRQIILRHWVLKKNTVKLIDFSCAKLIQKDNTIAPHTLRNAREYTSPEATENVRKQEPASNNPFKEDIWALGKVIYELAAGRAYRYLNVKPMEIVSEEVHSHLQSGGYLQLERAILAMLACEQASRCTASQALALLQDDLGSSKKPTHAPYSLEEEAVTEDPRYRCVHCGSHTRTQPSSQGQVCYQCSRSS